MVFSTLIAANILLTLVSRSFYFFMFTTFGYKNNLVVLFMCIIIALIALYIFVEPLADFFQNERLDFYQLCLSVSIGFAFVIWYELVKLVKRK